MLGHIGVNANGGQVDTKLLQRGTEKASWHCSKVNFFVAQPGCTPEAQGGCLGPPLGAACSFRAQVRPLPPAPSSPVPREMLPQPPGLSPGLLNQFPGSHLKESCAYPGAQERSGEGQEGHSQCRLGPLGGS